jgi:hypothetical protein
MDEFQHFITPSMAEILAGARKYRLGLILAHQELRHLDADRDVASAVLSNCFTRVVFKVGDADARALESGFTHFEARDLMNLEIGEAVCRVERSDHDFNLSIPNAQPCEGASSETSEAVIASSRAKYARPRAEVEAELLRKWQSTLERAASAPKSETPARTPTEPPAVTPPPPLPVVAEPKVESTAPIVSESPATVSEKIEESVPKPETEIGRGKILHRDTQRRIKMVAEEFGFRATLEAQVGSGSVDLLLERDDHRIVVEFSSTTGVTHETQNILKCVVGDFTHIAFVSAEPRKLESAAAMLRERIAESQFVRIGFYEVENFLAYLRTLPKRSAEAVAPAVKSRKPSERKVMGWTVKTETREQTGEEEAQAKAEMLRALGEALRKPPPE